MFLFIYKFPKKTVNLEYDVPLWNRISLPLSLPLSTHNAVLQHLGVSKNKIITKYTPFSIYNIV